MKNHARKFWTVASTKFSQEERAAHHVERQGFEFFLPRVELLTSRGFRREFLFPGYLFVRISNQWRSLMSTRGIARLFTHDETPVRIPNIEIDYFRHLEDERGFVVLPPPFVEGDAVVVTTGNLAGARGVVQGMDSRKRCLVLITLLGRTLNAALDTRALSPV